MFIKGLKFGLILQIAIGPVCLLILSSAINTNIFNAMMGVLAVTLIDGLYILFAILGISKLIQNMKNINILVYFSSFILFLFGLSFILGSFDINIIPSLKIGNNNLSDNTFTQATIITLSNPLTILFWAGVFGTKIIENKNNKKNLILFSIGCLSATALFLSFIILVGVLFKSFLSSELIKVMNVIVGLIVIYFSYKFLRKREEIKLA